MENLPTPTIPPTVYYVLQTLAGILLATISSILTTIFNRRKQSAETRKTDAETRQIDSAILFKTFERLDVMEKIIRDQGTEIMDLKHDLADAEYALSVEKRKRR